MKKLKFENKLKWTNRDLYCFRKESFKICTGEKGQSAIKNGWLYVFFWDNKLKEEFSE